MEIHQPIDLVGAIEILAKFGEEAKVLAGGTALNLLLRQRLITPAAIVDISRIPSLDRIDLDGQSIRIGSLTNHRAVELSEVVRLRLAVLAETFGKVGNVRVRNQATVGGVVSEADYASDPPAVLVGLDATIHVRGGTGERAIQAAEFFRGFYQTALEPTELVTGVSVPIPGDGFRAVYEKYVTRSAEDRPCVGVFAGCRRSTAGLYDDVRVVVGAASDRPQRFAAVEALAAGTDLGDDLCAQLAEGYAGQIEPLADVRGSAWYRSEMIRVWVRRALVRARDAA